MVSIQADNRTSCGNCGQSGTLQPTLLSDRFTFFNNCVTVRADEKAEKMEKPESGASSELRRRGGMVDTIDSKSIAREGVRVQVSSPVTF